VRARYTPAPDEGYPVILALVFVAPRFILNDLTAEKVMAIKLHSLAALMLN
jgi:hypothetical protein